MLMYFIQAVILIFGRAMFCNFFGVFLGIYQLDKKLGDIIYSEWHTENFRILEFRCKIEQNIQIAVFLFIEGKNWNVLLTVCSFNLNFFSN